MNHELLDNKRKVYNVITPFICVLFSKPNSNVLQHIILWLKGIFSNIKKWHRYSKLIVKKRAQYFIRGFTQAENVLRISLDNLYD